MIFTKAGRVISVIAVIFGMLRIVLGISAANSSDPNAFAARYIGSVTSGEAIDQGIEYLLFGVVLGVLTDISKAVGRNNE